MADGLRRARVGTALLFLLFGVALGTWTARVPAIKHGIGASDGRLSLALLGLAAGAITGMQAAGRLVDRYGSVAVLAPVALTEGVLLVPTGYAPGVGTLAAALFAFGVGHGILNIAMNAHAVRVERAYSRPIMSSFHAVYSIGGLLGAALGGLFARGDVGPRGTFLAVGAAVLVLAVVAVLLVRPALGDEPAPVATAPTGSTARPAGSGRLHGVYLLGLLVFCALVGEGAAADWSAVYLRDNLASSAGFAAVGYAAFAGAMTLGRLFGDRLVTRFGAVRLVRACGLLAAVGLGGALVVDQAWAGVVGFACLGAGMSCLAPQVYTAAGQRNPDRAGRALARVVSMGYAGFLLGPLLIGGAATQVGLPVALAIPAVLALAIAAGAGVLRSPAAPPVPLSRAATGTDDEPANQEIPSQTPC